ncbi:uncharacterized protein PV06_09004 [Exophiala oligosperma]|uniref:NAD(P)-binding protein n=2 Tax=Chaetothyriales TaxID=34395 RepID=A0A0D2D9R9_9EURO|nr:uncharacterized protein PV06_09004 [Exophiala oligosperma]KAJ9643820.1 hypothetical protein H2204_001965 [Knufia peltigerae]KIW39210.1 hypothetical protein PV06_09004 [Exophiala oligosperma]
MASQTIILVTGANSGIGFATAEVIASASPNYHVLVGSRNPENGKKAVADLKATGNIKGTLTDVQIDITDQSSVDALAKFIGEKFGRLDVLVNNAGIAPTDGSLRSIMDRTFQTNVTGPLVLTEALKPLLLKSKNPYSIYVSSGLGSLSMADSEKVLALEYPAYSASKSALNQMMIYESKNNAKNGINMKSFVMCPGFVRSHLRGKEEEQISGGGRAGDPKVSGQIILDIVEGRRDADVGKFVYKDGVYPW